MPTTDLSEDPLYQQFMETPLAELEGYGVDYSTIESLEKAYGIYIKNLIGLEPVEMRRTMRNFGHVRLAKLRIAMHACWQDICNADNQL